MPEDHHGQALMEIIIAIGVVAMLVAGLVVAVTSSLRFSESGRIRSMALKYAQEGIELARGLREKHTWDDFLSYGSPAGTLWCVGSTGVLEAEDGFGSCPKNLGGIFTRSVLMQWSDPKMKVTATVTWYEGGRTTSSTLTTYLTQWR